MFGLICMESFFKINICDLKNNCRSEKKMKTAVYMTQGSVESERPMEDLKGCAQ